MAESAGAWLHARTAYALLVVALAALLVAQWLPPAADAIRIVGIAALLLAPWPSLLAPGEDQPSRWPWTLALLGLLAVSFLL